MTTRSRTDRNQGRGAAPKRLNWGCGSHVRDGWINSDVKDDPGVDVVCDIRSGLPFETGALDYAVSVHALQELSFQEIVPALEELRRVLKPGGVLRMVLPDFDRAVRAYLDGRDDYFQVDSGTVKSRGGRFIVHVLWYGYSRTLFTQDFTHELLDDAGFTDVVTCGYRETRTGIHDIIDLDNREAESLFVEATNPANPSDDVAYNAAVAKRTAIEVVEVTTPVGSDRKVADGRILAMLAGDGESVIIQGWALGHSKRATAIELLDGEKVVARAEPNLKRTDVAERFPDAPGAATSGFRAVLKPEGIGESVLIAQVVLEDGSKLPVRALRLRVSRRRRFSRKAPETAGVTRET